MPESVLGLILPPAPRPIPAEAAALYPNVRFEAEWLGLREMTPAGYESVIERIEPAAQKLAAKGAQAIALMGTSLTFYKGTEFNRQLAAAIHGVTGLPVTTMSTAVVEGLHAVGGKRIGVAKAYSVEV